MILSKLSWYIRADYAYSSDTGRHGKMWVSNKRLNTQLYKWKNTEL